MDESETHRQGQLEEQGMNISETGRGETSESSHHIARTYGWAVVWFLNGD